MRAPGRLFWPVASLLLLADCTSKRAIEAAEPLIGVPRPVLDGFLRFTLAYNQGAAFSTHFGPYQRWALSGVSILILLALGLAYRQLTQLGFVATLGLALVVGGAAGNLLDRLLSVRGVVDFIDVGFGASRFYVFNLADAGISVGALLLAFALWQRDRARAAQGER